MHVNVLVKCNESHAYPPVTREKIVKIAKDMHNGSAMLLTDGASW